MRERPLPGLDLTQEPGDAGLPPHSTCPDIDTPRLVSCPATHALAHRGTVQRLLRSWRYIRSIDRRGDELGQTP